MSLNNNSIFPDNWGLQDVDNPSATLVDFPEFPAPTSPFGQDSLFVDKYKDLFARFLKSNNLSEIIYQNYCGGKPVTLYAVLNNEAVEINYITTLQAKNISKLTISEKDTAFFLFKKANRWKKSELPVEEIYNQGNCPFSRNVSDQEKEHLLLESKRHISFYKKPAEEKMLFFIEKDLEKVLSNPFYNDVKLTVEVTVQGQLSQNSNQIDNLRSFSLGADISGTYSNTEETPDIILKMVVDSKGRLTVKHVANPLYLKEYENKWEKEAQARGLEVNITKLRNEVIQDFERKETEYSFYQKFVQKTKALLNESIAGYAEAILATQKVVKHVWAEGTVNKGTWHTKDEEYTQWPEYMHMEPVTAGVTDGVIDEILGIKMAISAIYDIATDEEKRKALANVFTSEGIKQVYEGLMQEAQEIYNDPERSQHFVGQTTIAVGSMFLGGIGLFSKAGKLGEVLDSVSGFIKRITNPKVVKVYEDIRNFFLRKPKEGGFEVNDYLKRLDDDALNELGEELVEETDELTRLKAQPQKFIDGKKYENAIKKLIDEGNPQYLSKVAQEAGLSLEELNSYIPLHQVQIRIPNTNGGFTTMDDVWVKKVTDPATGKEYLETIVNDCKLSKDAPFSNRQLEFEKALDNADSYFDLRNTKFQDLPNISDRIFQNTEIRIKTYMKTLGDGGSPPDLTKFTVEKIK